jgi:hypothetical protein
MFPWSTPVCPCDPIGKSWVERNLRYLCEALPSNIFTDLPLVLPTREFFPHEHEPTSTCAAPQWACRQPLPGCRAVPVRDLEFHVPARLVALSCDTARYGRACCGEQADRILSRIVCILSNIARCAVSYEQASWAIAINRRGAANVTS